MITPSEVFVAIGIVVAVAAIYFFLIKKKENTSNVGGDASTFIPDPTPIENSTSTNEEVSMNKFALIVGINHYQLPGNDLSGCVNDANNMREFLINCAGFDPSNVKLITDSNATKNNILSGLRWLLSNSAPGVELFYYHSGHGTQVPDVSGDEIEDHLDEVLVTHDFDWNNPATQLLDDDLAIIFSSLPQGTFLSMVCDTCHSGSMTKDFIKNIAMPEHIATKMEGRVFIKRKIGVKKDTSTTPQRHILLSGCRDDQTSAEAVMGGEHQGALTYNFLKICSEQGAESWKNTQADIIKALRNEGYGQEPVLSGADELQARIVLGRKEGDIC
jgi:metacaspase-1